jgi:Ni/Co efflux regulator RcnB
MAAVAVPSAAAAERHHDRDRHERHHDWHDNGHRHGDRHWSGDRHHRHVAYVAPYRNWHYRPVRIGYHLSPIYYSPRYYIGDYGYYHVRAPGRWQQWIRYGDDLLLVNIRTGRVLEVIPYRYW